MTPQIAASLKLEIWREIMQREYRYAPGQATIAQPGGAVLTGTAQFQPVAAAHEAVKVFAVLYPEGSKSAKKTRNK